MSKISTKMFYLEINVSFPQVSFSSSQLTQSELETNKSSTEKPF